MPESFRAGSVPPEGFHSTLRGKEPGGLMNSTLRSSSSWSAGHNGLVRPSTALGLSSSAMSDPWGTFSRTRPPFDVLVPSPPKVETAPVDAKTLQDIRTKIYEKASNLKDVFLRYDRDKSGTISYQEFKTALKELNLDFPEPVVNGLLVRMDTDESGQIAYQEFASLLKAKDTMGEYNPFLLERTYYDGTAQPNPTDKKRSNKLTAKDINAAYALHHTISKRLYLKYNKPSRMFRGIDDNSNGAISSEEFVDKLKQLNIVTTPAEIDKLIDVFQIPTAGQLTYNDFVEHFQQPDKWGFCSPYNPVLRLGKNGEKNTHAPMDSTTMQKTHWNKQGRPDPRELLRRKKEMLKNMIATGQTIQKEMPTNTIVLPGKTNKGYLDVFLLQELRRKFTSMRKSTREMFRILDPVGEGRVSK